MAHLVETTQSLTRTPLFPLAQELKARFTCFGTWEMPVRFGSIIKEHEAVRNHAGMFDISHMGKFVFQGKNVVDQLQRLVPSDFSRLQPGESQYSVLLNENGGIIDDIIFYYQGTNNNGDQGGVLIVNAATTTKDRTWILKYIGTSKIEFQDISQDKVLIAIQGPKATGILQKFVSVDLNSIKAFGHLGASIFNQPAFLARTGYTGEDGFEVMINPEAGVELWQKLLSVGVVPCGLGARDILRLEASMALYGQDINDSTTPFEAGLGWLIHLDTKGDFIGREVLEQQKSQGITHKLVGLQMQGRSIARHGYPVLSSGEVVGKITSGNISLTLGYPVALAYLPKDIAQVGQQLEVEIRSKYYPAVVVKKPFYRSTSRLTS
ncbi:glycine cleavage system aminomethyltransferase GcvT [Richelia intracellularis]|nr:glycine cleavage system aminomethyltransferase GcvT [Richelia intracellularis]